MAPIHSIMTSFNMVELSIRSRSTADRSGNSSELSDPPSLTGDDSGSGSESDSDSDSDDHLSSDENSGPRTPRVRAMFSPNRKRSASRSFGRYIGSSSSESVLTQRLSKAISPYKRRKIVRDAPLSALEKLPNEILQRIATDLPTDKDFANITLSSPSIACRITPANSEVWRYKFIARYDHPMILEPHLFAAAYKTRQLILRNFAGFGHDFDRRRYLQLEVVRDMILETYFNPKPYRPGPKTSRNLRALSSPSTSPWVKALFAVPLAGFERNKRGRPNSWFDSLQVVLSHLLLSPISVLAHTTNTSRLNYSMLKVYNFNQQPTTLYAQYTVEANQPTVPFRSELFPNLRPSSNTSYFVYKLDVHTLLHIRNFWHRHLIDDSEPYGEHTYAAMARGLLKLGKSPREWDRPLYHDAPVAEKWVGHYSTLSPWPTTVKELEERQSLADSWNHVDPMTLDFVSTNDYAEGHWPPALSTIPCFQKTVPEPSEEEYERLFQNDGHSNQTRSNGTRNMKSSTKNGPAYIRGIAPFLDLPNVEEENKEPNTNDNTAQFPPPRPVNKAERYHPFASLRVRGVIHHINPSTTVDTNNDKIPLPRERKNPALPGWRRIVMVMYKPNIRYLLQVLDYAEERFGASVTAQPTMSLNAIIAALSPPVLNTGVFANANLVNIPSTQSVPVNTVPIPPFQTQQPTTSAPQTQPTAPAPAPPPAIQYVPAPPTQQAPLHIHLHNLLHNRLRAYALFRSHLKTPLFTPHQIAHLENAFSPPHALDWTDNTIDFAYAYEGVIIPGGKIMMGRWWRMHGADGDGEFREVDAEGNAVEIQRHDVESDEEDDDDDEVGSDGYDADVEWAGNGSGSGTGNTHGNGPAQPTYEYNSDNFQILGHGGLERTTAGLERGPFVFWC